MRSFARLFAALALFVSASAQAEVRYEVSTSILTIPSVKVGTQLYTGVTLENIGNFRFQLRTATLSPSPPTSFEASYEGVILTIPSVKVGTVTYINVTLTNIGNFTFDLLSATEQPPVGSGSAAACFDPAYLATGTKYDLNFRTLTNAVVVGTSKTENEVQGPTTFNGQSSIELKTKIEILTGTGSGTRAESRSFIQVQGLDVLTLGNLSEGTFSGFSATTTITFAPGVLFRYSLNAGESATTNYVATTTITVTGLPFNPPPTTSNQSITYTFLGFEDVTVPAGTFAGACKWLHSTTVNGVTTTSTEWITRKGAPLKSVSGTEVTELTSGNINGGPVGP